MRTVPLALVLLTAFLLGACEEPAPPPPAASPENGDLVASASAPITPRAPGEVLMLDVQHLLQASAEEGGEIYGVTRSDATRPWRTLDSGAADEQAVAAWLGRFAPLEADDRYPDLDPDRVMSDVTHRLVFRFDDGSGRTLSLQERADGLAAVSQADGPVFKLPAALLDDLVPPPAALRAE
jgi:hypothetical protein